MFDVKVTTSKAAADCGAACMTSFLAYYGINVTLEQMRKECNVQVSGCTAKDLLTCGRAHGLDMRAWRELEDDEAPDGMPVTQVGIFETDRPEICWWKYNHFVIFCGIEDGKAVIMNPTKGRYKISKSLFKAFYSRISVTNGEPQALPEN